MDTEEKIFAIIGVIIVALASIILFPILGGFVLKILWGWFVVKQFHLPDISIPEAIGLSFLVKCVISPTTPQTQTQKKQNLGEVIAVQIGYWLLTLLIGFIIHLFV